MLRAMDVPVVLQSRLVTAADLDQIRTLRAMHPGWSRRQVSVALATAWDWRTAAGRLKPIFDSSKSQLLVAEELTGADFV